MVQMLGSPPVLWIKPVSSQELFCPEAALVSCGPLPRLASDPALGRDECCARQDGGNMNHLPKSSTGSRPLAPGHALLAFLLPFFLEPRHPGPQPCPRDSWSAFPCLASWSWLSTPRAHISWPQQWGWFPRVRWCCRAVPSPSSWPDTTGAGMGEARAAVRWGWSSQGALGSQLSCGACAAASLREGVPWLMPSGDWGTGPVGQSLSP